ncbi:hypothetical protein D3C81_1574270 [compost metagenome]
MAKHTGAHIGRAVQRVDQFAVLRLGDGVDGQVAAAQVFFQRHVGAGIEGKALVAPAGLAFGARQRVFLFGARVQEHGKIAANGNEPTADHVFRRGAHHDPVVVAGPQAQQRVTHRAAHDIHLQAVDGRVLRRVLHHRAAVLSAPSGVMLPRRSFRDCDWPLNIAA